MKSLFIIFTLFITCQFAYSGECNQFAKNLSGCINYSCEQDESEKIRKVLPSYKGNAKTIFKIDGYKNGECQYSLHSVSSGKIVCSALRGDLIDVAKMHEISLKMESEVVASINTPALINQIIEKRLKSLGEIFKKKPHLAKKCKPVPNTKDVKLSEMIKMAMIKARQKK